MISGGLRGAPNKDPVMMRGMSLSASWCNFIHSLKLYGTLWQFKNKTLNKCWLKSYLKILINNSNLATALGIEYIFIFHIYIFPSVYLWLHIYYVYISRKTDALELWVHKRKQKDVSLIFAVKCALCPKHVQCKLC